MGSVDTCERVYTILLQYIPILGGPKCRCPPTSKYVGGPSPQKRLMFGGDICDSVPPPQTLGGGAVLPSPPKSPPLARTRLPNLTFRRAVHVLVQRQKRRQLRNTYADITTGVDFIPVAIETWGTWGEQGIDLIREIGRRIAKVTHEPRATLFLRQRPSVAFQRRNAVCVIWEQFGVRILWPPNFIFVHGHKFTQPQAWWYIFNGCLYSVRFTR